MLNTTEHVAIDPMALILKGDAYLLWCEIHHPHVPSTPEIKELFKRMTPEQRKMVISRSKMLTKYGEALVECGNAIANAGR
jgi:hypothetical protein